MERTPEYLAQYKNVWVFAEQRNGKLMPVVIELMGEGKKIASQIGTELCAVLLGSDVKNLADELISYGADKVYLCENELFKNYTTDGYYKTISELINEYKPEVFLIGATHIGRDLAPRISATVDTGLTADCTKILQEPEK